MKKYAMRAFALALVLGTGVAFSSCKDEEKVNPDVEIVETELGTYVSGVVTDGSTALSGVTVTAGDASATTDASGAYMLPVSAGAVTGFSSGQSTPSKMNTGESITVRRNMSMCSSVARMSRMRM